RIEASELRTVSNRHPQNGVADAEVDPVLAWRADHFPRDAARVVAPLVWGAQLAEWAAIITALQYQALRRIRPTGESHLTGGVYLKNGKPAKLDMLVGGLLGSVRGKVVIDFGCGDGQEAVAIASRGAARVVGLDLNTELLERARRRAEAAGVHDRVEF